MSQSASHLGERTQDSADLLEDIMTSAITLAMMLRQKTMAAWLRTESEGYPDADAAPPYRRDRPGCIIANSPQHGWMPARVNDQQKQDFGYLDLLDGTASFEQLCASSKKGSGKRLQLSEEALAALQKQINLSAELAISVGREEYSNIVKIVRGAIYLWTKEIVAKGLGGEHSHYTVEQRESVAELDNPQKFWLQAVEKADSLPIPDVKPAGLLDRMFKRTN